MSVTHSTSFGDKNRPTAQEKLYSAKRFLLRAFMEEGAAVQ